MDCEHDSSTSQKFVFSCHSVVTSRYAALKKSLKVLTSFFKYIFYWILKGTLEKHKMHLYFPSFESNKLIIV